MNNDNDNDNDRKVWEWQRLSVRWLHRSLAT